MNNIVPNLFLIGAPKSGTTAISEGLSRHPKVYCEKKEPRFFDAPVFYDDPELYPIKSMSDYLKLYDNNNARLAKYRLDASVFNMYSVEAINSILDMNVDAKFILVLRDPIDASKSMFRQRLKYVRKDMREISDDFSVCWGKLEERKFGRGFPEGCKNSVLFRYDFLYQYESLVPGILGISGLNRDNFIILRYEDFKFSSEYFLNMLFSWLGLSSVDNIGKLDVINPSFALSSGGWNVFIEKLAKKSLPIRRVLNLTGSNVAAIKKMSSAIKLRQNVNICDDVNYEMKKEFESTYRYLVSAERDGVINRLRC